MQNLCILMLSNTSVYLILTEIPAFFFCDGLNVKKYFIFYKIEYGGLNVKNKSNFCSTYVYLDECQFKNLAKYAFLHMSI